MPVLHAGARMIQKKPKYSAKIEPSSNLHQLEREGADIQTKVKELEEQNQSLRQRDKVKDDAIAQLSDQLVSLSLGCRK